MTRYPPCPCGCTRVSFDSIECIPRCVNCRRVMGEAIPEPVDDPESADPAPEYEKGVPLFE